MLSRSENLLTKCVGIWHMKATNGANDFTFSSTSRPHETSCRIGLTVHLWFISSPRTYIYTDQRSFFPWRHLKAHGMSTTRVNMHDWIGILQNTIIRLRKNSFEASGLFNRLCAVIVGSPDTTKHPTVEECCKLFSQTGHLFMI